MSGTKRGTTYLRKAMYKGTKTARKRVTEVELSCPVCNATIPSPGGRLMWDVNEIGAENAAKCTCPDCGLKLRFPRL